MKARKKGFTLIELLAVIVILAIIALIATPMIMGVIDKAKKGAAESSALGYIDAVEKYSVYGMLDQTAGTAALPAGVYEYNDTELNTVQLKGDKPEAGWVAINDQGIVVAASLKFSMYAKYIGYTEADHAKATLDTLVTKPVKTEEQKMEEFIESAKTAVHNALNPV